MKNNKKKKLVLDEEDTSSSSRSLPHDTIEDILSRLPVKSLLRFKTVCKSWNHTISDPRFAETHLHQSRKSTSQTYLLMWYADARGGGGPHVVRYENRKSRSAVAYPWRDYLNVGCCCDGLVLKYLRDSSEYVLWNPSARSYIKFGCPPSLRLAFLHGLCYDHVNKDYKVVIGDQQKFAVFHCRNNHWGPLRGFQKRSTFGEEVLGCRGVPFGRGFYWILDTIRRDEDDGLKFKSTEMVVYDSGDDALYKVPMPSFRRRGPGKHTLALTVLGGYLCLVVNNRGEPSDRIWCVVKTGDSWVEIDEALPFSCRYVVPVFLTNEEEMILDVGDRECFVVCDLRRRSYEKIRVSSIGGLCPRSVPCLENMFFSCLDKRKVNSYAA